MTYKEIMLKAQSCPITNEDEFDAFIDDLAEAVEDVNLSLAERSGLIKQLLLNIEKQEELEFTSWSLIHFIESLDQDDFTNYNSLLLESLKRKPKFLNLLLVNRLLNSLPSMAGNRTMFLVALKEVACNYSFEEIVRNKANEFHEYQMNKKD